MEPRDRAYTLREDLTMLVGRAVCIRRVSDDRTIVSCDGFEVAVLDLDLTAEKSWNTTSRVARQIRQAIGLGA